MQFYKTKSCTAVRIYISKLIISLTHCNETTLSFPDRTGSDKAHTFLGSRMRVDIGTHLKLCKQGELEESSSHREDDVHSHVLLAPLPALRETHVHRCPQDGAGCGGRQAAEPPCCLFDLRGSQRVPGEEPERVVSRLGCVPILLLPRACQQLSQGEANNQFFFSPPQMFI